MRIVLACGVLAGLAGAAALSGCNAMLGIGAASLESEDDGGTDAAGGDAGGGDDGGGPLTLSCASYCATIMRNCTGANAEYLSPDICLSMCPALELNTTIGDTMDDTLGCRLFHARAAALTPNVSCRFAGPLGGGHCGDDPCLSFCTLDVGYCVSPRPVPYEGGIPECRADCTTYPYVTVGAGDTTTEDTNTLNCRLWHLETAFTDPQSGLFHCAHTDLASATCTKDAG
jgi:hypothetical protein